MQCSGWYATVGRMQQSRTHTSTDVRFRKQNFLRCRGHLKVFTAFKYKTTVLPAKSDSDVMLVNKVIKDLESINHLCINPVRR